MRSCTIPLGHLLTMKCWLRRHISRNVCIQSFRIPLQVLSAGLEWTIINKPLEAAHAKEATTQKPPPKPPAPRAFPNPPAPQPTPLTSRPTIKFKAPQPKEAAATAATSKPPKQPKRKLKVELPPAELPADPPHLPMSTMGHTTFSRRCLHWNERKRQLPTGRGRRLIYRKGRMKRRPACPRDPRQERPALSD
jgi:hypothetical protein